MESSNELQNHCFREWKNLQEQELSELLKALNADHSGGEDVNNLLHRLIETSIQNIQDYIMKRASLAINDVSPYFAPNWCSSLELSMLWIGGCRPSKYVRLLYAIIGKEIESRLEEYLRGKRNGRLGDVSATQMNMINDLQRKIFKAEDKLTKKLASLQEDMGDQPIATIALEMSSHHDEATREANDALDVHARTALRLLEEADHLRLNFLKEIVLSILTPLQAVEFLAATKKLHLCIHNWGKIRDDQHGRTKN